MKKITFIVMLSWAFLLNTQPVKYALNGRFSPNFQINTSGMIFNKDLREQAMQQQLGSLLLQQNE